MRNLQVTINFRDKSSQTLQKNVTVNEKIDLNLLHKSILSIQKETNDLLTNLVEKEKQSGKIVNNSKCRDVDSNNEDEEDADDVEPPEKLQKT